MQPAPKQGHFLRDIAVGGCIAVVIAILACVGLVMLIQQPAAPAASVPTYRPPTLTPGEGTKLPTDTVAPPTATIAPSATASMQDQLKASIAQLTSKSASQIEVDSFDGNLITFKFPLSDLSADFAKSDAQSSMPKIACFLKTFSVKSAKYIVYGTVPVKDVYGNQSIGNGVIMTLTPSNLSKFNCSDPDLINIARAADSYTISPVLQ